MCSGAWKRGPEIAVGVISLASFLFDNKSDDFTDLINQFAELWLTDVQWLPADWSMKCDCIIYKNAKLSSLRYCTRQHKHLCIQTVTIAPYQWLRPDFHLKTMSSSGAPWVSQVSHVNSVISGYRVTFYQPAVNIEISVNEPRVSKAPSDVSVCKWGSLKPHLHIRRHQGIYSNYFDWFLNEHGQIGSAHARPNKSE